MIAKRMSPQTAKNLSWLIIIIVTASAELIFHPAWLADVTKLINDYSYLACLALFAFVLSIVIRSVLMVWFGQRDADGEIEQYVNPDEQRLQRIEAAINRLHKYVQEIDPDLEQERRLLRSAESDDHMLAGMSHLEYVQKREAEGKRTLFRSSIWRDPSARQPAGQD